jgi:2-hydroxychromene-2-carboxylate isomerase
MSTSRLSQDRLLAAVYAQLTHDARVRRQGATATRVSSGQEPRFVTERTLTTVEPVDGVVALHPHALAASVAAEAAALQGRFWAMHDLLFHRQTALEDQDLRGYAAELGLDLLRFDNDRKSAAVLRRVGRDVESRLASGQVMGTPTLFIDGALHRGGYERAQLLQALGR